MINNELKKNQDIIFYILSKNNQIYKFGKITTCAYPNIIYVYCEKYNTYSSLNLDWYDVFMKKRKEHKIDNNDNNDINIIDENGKKSKMRLILEKFMKNFGLD